MKPHVPVRLLYRRGPPLATKCPFTTADDHHVMHLFRKDGTRKRVEALIREGIGVREQSWELHAADADGDSRALLGPVVAWVRESMADMRRPYGIDHVALALACRDDEGHVLLSNSFGVTRPAIFWGPEGEDRVAAFLDDVEESGASGAHEVVGALLRLGDIAFELSARKAAA